MSSPVVAAGMVFVGSDDGYLYAVNATTGTRMWASWVGTDINSPTLAHDKVFITSTFGTLFAFDMYSGEGVWNRSIGEEAGFGAPLIVGSRVFVNGNNTVYAFNEAVGVRLYDEAIPHVNGITRLMHTDGLVIAFASRSETEVGLNGFEVKTGRGRFWITLSPTGNDRVTKLPTMENVEVFAVAQGLEGNSASFGLSSMGMILWEHQLNGVTDAAPATAYNTVYVPTSSFVYALNATDGAVQWSLPTNGGYAVSSPAVADGKVYLGLENGYVYALDAFSGDLIWSYKTDGSVQSSPAISDGLLFVGSNDGILYAIGFPTFQAFNAGTWNDTTHKVSIQSNVAVTDFTFNQPLKQVSFNVTNVLGTVGFCNVTFPSSLLKGPHSVSANENQPLPFEEQTNGTHSLLYFNFSHDISSVRIEGAEAIPEFPSWTLILAAPAMFVVIVAVSKLGSHKKTNNGLGQ